MPKSLHVTLTDPLEYAAWLRQLANDGYVEQIAAYLEQLPADHTHWDCVIGEFGESTLIGFGVDV